MKFDIRGFFEKNKTVGKIQVSLNSYKDKGYRISDKSLARPRRK